MGRRYRRKSQVNQIISDSVVIGSRLPWWGAFLFGLISFLTFYYVIPHWLESSLADEANSRIYPAMEAIYGRGIRLFRYIGIATGAVGLFFAVRNYFLQLSVNRSRNHVLALLARLIGRQLD